MAARDALGRQFAKLKPNESVPPPPRKPSVTPEESQQTKAIREQYGDLDRLRRM